MNPKILLLLITVILFTSFESISQNISLVKDITPSGSSFVNVGEEMLAHIGDTILFSNYNETSSKLELWRSDGTENGTYVILETSSMNHRFQFFGQIGTDTLLFHLKTNVGDDKIFTTNSTLIGTKHLTFIPSNIISNVKYVNGNIYYTTYSDIHKASIKLGTDEIFLDAGTRLNDYHFKGTNTLYYAMEAFDEPSKLVVKNLETEEDDTLIDLGEQFSGGMFFREVNNKLLFFFNNDDSLRLYVSDGTDAGTKKIAGFYNGSGYFADIRLVSNNRLFFDAYYAEDGINLTAPTFWVSDGTAAGTYPLYSETNQIREVDQAIEFKNEVYFTADNGRFYSDILKTDGTVNGTTSIINSPYSGIGYLQILENSIYFLGGINDNNIDFGYEILKSDGTETNIKIYETAPGIDDLYPSDLYASENKLFLTAFEEGTDRELYVLTPVISAVDKKEQRSFQCYPNPFTDKITIHSDKGQKITNVRLTDLSGKQIPITESANFTELSLENLYPGIYLLQIDSEGASEIIKVIKK